MCDGSASDSESTFRAARGGGSEGNQRGGGDIYVANFGDGTKDGSVSLIDPTTNTVIGTLAVGNGPTGIAANPGGFIYVTNFMGNTVSVIDPG